MTSASDDTTRALPGNDEQRRLLRLALQAQRLRIAEQLPPAIVPRAFPRSATMRFLAGKPAIAAGLLAQFAPGLAKAPLLRAATIAFTIVRMFRTASGKR